MSSCTHPRSQVWDDNGVARCGACGDIWDNVKGTWVPYPGLEEPMSDKPRVVIVDMRSGGGIKADGSNIDLPSEGQESALRSIETADVYVQVHADGIYVKEGADKGWVLLITTKGEAQMSHEKAERDLAKRERGPEVPIGMTGDRPTFEDDPVDQKFARVWEDSGPTRTERLKGY